MPLCTGWMLLLQLLVNLITSKRRLSKSLALMKSLPAQICPSTPWITDVRLLQSPHFIRCTQVFAHMIYRSCFPLRMLDVVLLDPVCLCQTMLSPFQMVKTHTLDRSFVQSATRVWNSLPEYVVREITDTGIQAFKCQVHGHLLTYGTL